MTRQAAKKLRKERRLRTEYGYDVNKIIKQLKADASSDAMRIAELEAEVKQLKAELSAERRKTQTHQRYREVVKAKVNRTIRIINERHTKELHKAQNAGSFDRYKARRPIWTNAAVAILNDLDKNHPGFAEEVFRAQVDINWLTTKVAENFVVGRKHAIYEYFEDNMEEEAYDIICETIKYKYPEANLPVEAQEL